jgi:hypothetical protein
MVKQKHIYKQVAWFIKFKSKMVSMQVYVRGKLSSMSAPFPWVSKLAGGWKEKGKENSHLCMN